MITNYLPIISTNYSVGNFLPIGSKTFLPIINLPMALGANSSQWFTTGSYWHMMLAICIIGTSGHFGVYALRPKCVDRVQISVKASSQAKTFCIL